MTCSPVLQGIPLATEPCIVFDLSVGCAIATPDFEEPRLTEILFAKMRAAGVRVGIGRYNEARALYTAPEFASGPRPTDERRTVHLGLDLFAEPGTVVCAPVAGTVHAFNNNAQRLDYGPVIILNHGDSFTLYGHLTLDSLDGLRAGQCVEAGQPIGKIGMPPENGGWTPHLHFQIIKDLLELDCDFPGVALPREREKWLRLSPDPNVLVGIPASQFPAAEPSKLDTLESRREHLGGNLSISYREPLKIVRGWRQFLYDENGRAYLDVYNNVPLVGHSHPRVVEAVAKQMAVLNTNTRYLHDNIVRYAERLTAKFPARLSVCYFLNSASEANELALRMARACTKRNDVIVLEHAYHGHTNTLIDISPYKFDGPGGNGRRPFVHVAPLPDPHRRDDPAAGVEYAGELAKLVDGPMTFIAESLPSVGGQVVFPGGYLAGCYEAVRAAGGVCIADEVQVGFGRLGEFFSGFEMQQVVPDIVVLGKPMGNGFPLAGVVTTREIAETFDNGMEFFSTYGGNPVACAAGLAVLDVLEDERLPENAARVGEYLMSRLRGLDFVDVRGRGLFLGVELANGEEASRVVNGLRGRGVLAGTDGPKHNVIKIRPPLIFSERDTDLLVETLLAVNERE
jgi:4-aminobutyrate aminotransferase-like enzyme